MSSGFTSIRDFHVALKMAWHRLTNVKKPEESDFPEIVKSPVFFGPDKTPLEGAWIPVSTDDNKPVGVVCFDSYHLFTPRDGLKYVTECLAGTSAKLSSIGMIFNRSKWFANFELDELTALVRPGHSLHLLVTGGLDKSESPSLMLSDTESVCDNTRRMALEKGKSLFASRLTRNFANRLEQARETVESAVGMARIWNETITTLEKTKAKKDDVISAFRGEISQRGATLTSTRASNIIEGLESLYVGGTKGGSTGENWWQACRAFTEFYGRGIDAGTTRDDFSRWESSEFGGFAMRKDAFCDAISTTETRNGLVKVGRDAYKRDLAKLPKVTV